MCTAATYKTKGFYFGRTLDHERSYGEEVTITPKNFVLPFRYVPAKENHYAMIGMAHVLDDYPLYYDAVNEEGLAMAGLNFVGDAHYREAPKAGGSKEWRNPPESVVEFAPICQFEFIPWILSQCACVEDAKILLAHTVLVDTPFRENLPVAELHWMIADENSAITVEYVSDGLKIYENTVGILTNNPPFDKQLSLLNEYADWSSIPADSSSTSRFVRAAFARRCAVSGNSEEESVNQFFHILGSVEQSRGCHEVRPSEYKITVYTSCMSVTRGIYYYTTYENHQISAVDMRRVDLEETKLFRYPLRREEAILRH